MSFHTETYEHNGLPVYVFPAVDHDAVGNKVATIACPFLGEYPQLHSKSSIHKRKVFSDVGCGGFTRSMENHARDKTSCGRMFKKPCYLQAADGPLKLYDPTASLDTKSDDEDKENRDPNIRVSERSTTARKVVKDSVKSASEQVRSILFRSSCHCSLQQVFCSCCISWKKESMRSSCELCPRMRPWILMQTRCMTTWQRS